MADPDKINIGDIVDVHFVTQNNMTFSLVDVTVVQLANITAGTNGLIVRDGNDKIIHIGLNFSYMIQK